MDKYYEQFITKDYGSLPNLMNVISKTMLMIGILIIVSLGILGIIIGAVFIIIFIALEISMFKKFVEYEYEYIDGELTLSKVIGKKKRKILGKLTISSISKVCVKTSLDRTQKPIVCTLDNTELKEVVIINNDKKAYLVGLDEKMHQILKRANSSLFAYI